MMFAVVPGWVRRAAHITLLQLSLGGILSLSASGASVTLAWDPSPDPTAVGYNLYYGVASRTYTVKINVGSSTTCTVSNLVPGTTYYFAATTYDLAGLESDFSPEVSYLVPTPEINQPPTLDPIANVVISENAGLQTVSLSGISSGSATENQTLNVTATSGNPSLIPNPQLNYTSPSTTGSLTFTPANYASGSATITVTVDDGAPTNNILTRTFAVTVYPVNQPPTLDPIADLSLSQNAGSQTVNLTGITSGAPNENQTLTVTAASSNPNLIPNPKVSYNSARTTGSLSFTPAANSVGSATVTVTVNDGGASNNIVSQSFVVSVNHPPTISSIPDRTIATDTDTGPISFTVGDAETAANLLSVTKSSSNPLLVPQSAIVLGGTGANRTVTITPAAGQTGIVNIALSVSDGLATASTTFNLTVQSRPSPPGNLHIVVQGNGTLSPDLTTQTLIPGRVYRVTAVPQADHEFAGWTGSITSSSRTITFMMTTDFFLQANFVKSPFVPAAGLYDGLFYDPAGVAQQSAGRFRLVCTKKGVYSGSLRLGPNRYAFKGRFGLDCLATNMIARRTNSPLQLELVLGSEQGLDQVTGRLTDGSWTASLAGNRAVFNARTDAAPWSKSYTFVLPGQDSDSTLPRAHGYGVASVNRAGIGRLAGRLADGTPFSQGAYVSREGQWPFHVPLYGGHGMLISWLTFADRSGDDINGALSWIKPQLPKARYFPDGFQYECEAIGSIYTPPSPQNPVLGYTDAHANFTGGNLGQGFANAIQFGVANRVTNLSSNRLSLGFALGKGIFRGVVTDPTLNRRFAFAGVAFQKQSAAYGLLFGTNQTSRVVISN